LQKNLERIEEAGIQLVGISYDPVDVLRSFSDSNQITFPLLSDHYSDTQNRTIRDFQLLDTREKGKYAGVPVPTTLLVDSQKKIRAVLPGTRRQRSDAEQLISQAGQL